MQSMNRHPSRSSVVMLAILALAGCHSVQTKAPAEQAGGDAVVFPDPAHATVPEGIFVNLENLRLVAPGMSKDQLYALLGAPHFNEGIFGVRKWNYLFDFRKDEGSSDHFSCQYQIEFDKDGRSTGSNWKPESCRTVLARRDTASVAPAPVLMPREPVRLSSEAIFDFDRATLTAEGRDQLSRLLQQVQGASGVEDIFIVGYTDIIGSDRYNLELSRRRAYAVRNYLVAGGVPDSAIRVEGRGDADPRVTCPRSSRAALIVCLSPNRRVELSGLARH
jgi:outer membrane protein OmpA-like peptidoglycan-associated protein